MKRLLLTLTITALTVLAVAQTPQAIWTPGNKTLTFYYGRLYSPGETFNGLSVARVWSGEHFNDIENRHRSSNRDDYYWQVPGWVADDVYIDANDNQVTDYTDICVQIETAVFDQSFQNYKIRHTQWLFEHCHNLTKIVGMENLCTDIVTDMRGMFCDCKSLPEIDLSHLNTSNVTNMAYFLSGCGSLKSVDLSPLDTRNVQKMAMMFNECSSLTTIDLSTLNTHNVKQMFGLLADCKSLTKINLADFDISNADDISYMFYGCDNLQRIYCDKDWATIRPDADGESMFEDCPKLEGALPYDRQNLGLEMANPTNGYFTCDIITIEKYKFTHGLTWEQAMLNPKEFRYDIQRSGSFRYLIGTNDATNTISDPGTYDLTILFTSNDNSIRYSQNFQIDIITLDAKIQIETSPICTGNIAEILLSDIKNVTPTHYTLQFSDNAFQSKTHEPFASANIPFQIPENASGDYTATITLHSDDENLDSRPLSANFTITPSQLKTKWDDVVYIPNPDSKYTAYRWFRDDEEIVGAKKQFFNELGGLNGVYYAIVTDNDGNEHKTCPLNAVKQTDNSAPGVNVFPNPAVAGEQITLQLENMDIAKGVELLIYTSSASFVQRIPNAQHTNCLTLPKGGYMGYAIYEGKNVAFKIMVEK